MKCFAHSSKNAKELLDIYMRHAWDCNEHSMKLIITSKFDLMQDASRL